MDPVTHADILDRSEPVGCMDRGAGHKTGIPGDHVADRLSDYAGQGGEVMI